MLIQEFIEKNDLQKTFSVSAPLPVVKDEWPCIGYTITISNNSKAYSFVYHLGVGHVKYSGKAPYSFMGEGLSKDEECMFYTRQRKPSAIFKDKHTEASLATKLAKAQKVTPHFADILNGAIDSIRNYTDAMDFDTFCAEYGYDNDSIKALDTYNAVMNEGKQFIKVFGKELCAELTNCERL